MLQFGEIYHAAPWVFLIVQIHNSCNFSSKQTFSPWAASDGFAASWMEKSGARARSLLPYFMSPKCLDRRHSLSTNLVSEKSGHSLATVHRTGPAGCGLRIHCWKARLSEARFMTPDTIFDHIRNSGPPAGGKSLWALDAGRAGIRHKGSWLAGRAAALAAARRLRSPGRSGRARGSRAGPPTPSHGLLCASPNSLPCGIFRSEHTLCNDDGALRSYYHLSRDKSRPRIACLCVKTRLNSITAFQALLAFQPWWLVCTGLPALLELSESRELHNLALTSFMRLVPLYGLISALYGLFKDGCPKSWSWNRAATSELTESPSPKRLLSIPQ